MSVRIVGRLGRKHADYGASRSQEAWPCDGGSLKLGYFEVECHITRLATWLHACERHSILPIQTFQGLPARRPVDISGLGPVSRACSETRHGPPLSNGCSMYDLI